ncbi:MAG: lipopolysaccharide biosynthesis protein [Clostridiales bacterium]|nr:lipopolysaccharide biosynthesis protein [Clostridiales bacterium]
MSEQSSKKGMMAKDTVIYMLAKGFEGVVGILTLSIMTWLFLPEKMGQYSNVNIAVTTAAMFAIQWLVQSVLRYINKYDIENEQEKFFTTVFTAWLKVNIIVIFFGIIALIIINSGVFKGAAFSRFLDVYTPTVMFFALLMFITYNTAQLMISMLAAVREAKTNLFISVFSVTGKIALIYILATNFGRRIEWIFLSYAVFDGITSVIGIFKLKIYKYINVRKSSPEILKDLKAYGIPLMGNLIATSVLNKSDIYIITGFKGEAQAGIYQTNYSIIASAFTLLSAAVMRGSYPTILKTWSEGKKELSANLVSEAVRMFLLISVPAVFGVLCVSDTAAGVLFESGFVEGHTVMVWVAAGMTLLGLTEYCIKPWELNARTKSIFYRSLIGGIVNIAVNLIFVPVFGYYAAAVSTFIGFFVYFTLAYMGTRKLMRWNLPLLVYIRIIISAVIMAMVIMAVRFVTGGGVLSLCCMIGAGIIAYVLALFFTGEIKREVKAIINVLRK